MPQWSNTPPVEPDRYAMRIVRTPPTGAIDAIVTSPDILGCFTHFVHRRTIPCEGAPDCPHCQAGFSYRWHGYLAAVAVKGLEHFLFEFTANAAQTFTTYRDLHGTLRACHFLSRRPSGRTNGRIVIKCRMHDEAEARLPRPPDLKAILMHIWNIQNDEPNEWTNPETSARQMAPKPSNGDGRYSQTVHEES